MTAQSLSRYSVVHRRRRWFVATWLAVSLASGTGAASDAGGGGGGGPDATQFFGAAPRPPPSRPTGPSGATFYSTKIESYQRIQFDAAAGKFYVWSKHGDRTTYRPVHGVSCTASGCPDTFRYGIGAMTDPHGNTVGYNWWCDPGNDCFPDSITYNQTVIKLYAEQRPDPYGFATGSSPGRKNYRLKTIDITTAGSRVRSYQLSYTA